MLASGRREGTRLWRFFLTYLAVLLIPAMLALLCFGEVSRIVRIETDHRSSTLLLKASAALSRIGRGAELPEMPEVLGLLQLEQGDVACIESSGGELLAMAAPEGENPEELRAALEAEADQTGPTRAYVSGRELLVSRYTSEQDDMRLILGRSADRVFARLRRLQWGVAAALAVAAALGLGFSWLFARRRAERGREPAKAETLTADPAETEECGRLPEEALPVCTAERRAETPAAAENSGAPGKEAGEAPALRQTLPAVAAEARGRAAEAEARPRMIDEISAYIREHYSEAEMTLASVAERFHISESHLSFSFKAQQGTNFFSYVESLRIARAKTLLREDNQKICDIARMVGYSSVNSFCRAFKRSTGESATDYRNGIGEESTKP